MSTADYFPSMLKIIFSATGNYTGCGNSYTVNTTLIQDVDPLSGLVTSPWYTRFLPSLQWSTLPGDLFTLIIYDAGYLPTHGIYTNIKGTDMSTATVRKPVEVWFFWSAWIKLKKKVAFGNKEHTTDRKLESRFYWDSLLAVMKFATLLTRIHE